MSRIAGFASDAADPRTEHLISRMLAAMASPADAAGKTVPFATGGLGYLGRRPSGLAARDGLLAVVDGTFYHVANTAHAGSEAETLLNLYLRHGFREALERINGDFAAAVWDPRQRTLWLGRDRLGIRPLYYVPGKDFFAFASRPAGLLALPGVSAEPDRRFVALFAASHYRVFDNDPEASPYAAVRQLPAGCLLRFSPGGVAVERYWDLRDRGDFDAPEEELAARYRDLLLDAVAVRLAAASRPAFTLSGGMDSSSVLACAVRGAGSRQQAFSSVYEDKTFDESEEIQSMLRAGLADWHPVPIGDPDVFATVERMVAAHDEPVATATWLSHFLLCEAVAANGHGALFGGLGGDELNAGEYEYFLCHFADLRQAGREEELAGEVAWWARYHDHPVYRKTPAVVEANFRRLIDFSTPGRCLPDRDRLCRYQAALNPDWFDLSSFVPVMDHPFASCLKNRTYQDIFRETAPCCLRAEDRQTAWFGLDHFLPFFDYRLVEFMYRVPGSMKIRDGVTKHLLRRAMRGILPEETRTRVKKTGWNAPAHVWFTGKALEQVRDLVASQAFRERGVYDPVATLALLDAHERIVAGGQPAENHMMFIWQLLNLEIWLRRPRPAA